MPPISPSKTSKAPLLVSAVLLLLVCLLSTSSTGAHRGLKVITLSPDGLKKEVPLYSGYYALVIGCGEYRSGWPPLPNPVKDAQEVARALKEMGWEVDLLEDPDGDQLDLSLTSLITGPGRRDDVAMLIWFSGHGHTLQEADGTKLGYIVPVDAPRPSRDEVGFMRKAIDMRQLETVAKRVRSKHVLMVFDSCFSGAVFAMVRAAPSDYIQEKVSWPVREFITAGNEDEQVPDRSVFKTCFIQGVKDGFADMNRDGYVTGEELGAYLQEKVVNYTRKAQHPQFGKINNPKLDKGDFVFVLKAGEPKPPPVKASSATVVSPPAERKPARRELLVAKKVFEPPEDRETVEKEIRRVVGGVAKAFNERDMNAFLNPLTQDIDFATPSQGGMRIRGIDNLRSSVTQAWANVPVYVRAENTNFELVQWSGNSAVAKEDWAMLHTRTPKKFTRIYHLIRVEGAWKIKKVDLK